MVMTAQFMKAARTVMDAMILTILLLLFIVVYVGEDTPVSTLTTPGIVWKIPAQSGMMPTLRTVETRIPPLLLLLFNVVNAEEDWVNYLGNTII